VLLRGISRSAAGSLYDVGGRLGLLDWYRWSRGGTALFSMGEGVGLLEERWVTVGEIASSPRYQ